MASNRCCRCMNSGTCSRCSCAVSGVSCRNCYPGKKGRCVNMPSQKQPPTRVSNDSHSNSHGHSTSSPSGNDNYIEEQEDSAEPDSSKLRLPDFTPPIVSLFEWGAVDGATFVQDLDRAYSLVVVHWKNHNRFVLPIGKVGEQFVSELARLYASFGNQSNMESIALKATVVMPSLLLQKPFRKSKTKDHIQILDRRLLLWIDGDLKQLLDEGLTIQSRLRTHGSSFRKRDTQHSFANSVFNGKIKEAIDFVTHGEKGKPLNINDISDTSSTEQSTVRDVLFGKHPDAQPADPNLIDYSTPPVLHPVTFDCIDATAIRSVALQVSGAAGPSGVNAYQWRRLCVSHKKSSLDLCEALALVARRLCTTYVDPHLISPLVASRLIALDKNPGVRPIGIGDVARRIIAKTILQQFRLDIQDATGSLQLCGGQISGIEAAVHAAHSEYDKDSSEAALLVDARNAFNLMNRQAALHNIRRSCPSLSTFLINTYRDPSYLFIDGEELLSKEGTTQGDPMAMPMYALATIPLIKKLDKLVKQIWYADDVTALGNLTELRRWWDKLNTIGPKFGYFTNPTKSWLIVKEEHHDKALSIFANSGIQVTTKGRPLLGSAIGTESYVSSFVTTKVKEWSKSTKTLASLAVTQPHAAYSVFTHGFSNLWTYILRTIPNISHLLEPLDTAIRLFLIPAVTGRIAPNNDELTLFSLPARLGGINITLPSTDSDRQFQASLKVCKDLSDQILLQNFSYDFEVIEKQVQSKNHIHVANSERIKKVAEDLLPKLSKSLQRSIAIARQKGASSWLTCLPIREHGFNLHKSAFIDAISLRYGWFPPRLPQKCSCGSKFNVEHALSCNTGGFPIIRHNELRDLTADLLSVVCKDVCIEPELQPVTNEDLSYATANRQDGARLDIAANGIWGGRFEKTFFDVRVFNPHANSYIRSDLSSVYVQHEKAKKREYAQRVLEIENSSFTPLVFSAAGGMGSEANVFYKRLADMLSQKWNNSYSTTLCWLRCRVSFSLLRSAIQSIRGSRSKSSVNIFPFVDLINREAHCSD